MIYTYKVRPVGDGSLYGWTKFNERGEALENSQQHWPSAADAEKALRTLVTGDDVIEVENMNNINPEANTNVVIVQPRSEEDDRLHGMTPVSASIEDTEERGSAADGDNENSVPVAQPTESAQQSQAIREENLDAAAEEREKAEKAQAAKEKKAAASKKSK